MPRPTTATGWSRLLLDHTADGKIDNLASLCGVTTRTLHRWQTEDIKLPDLQQRKLLRNIAGPHLISLPECPSYLRSETAQTDELENLGENMTTDNENEIQLEIEEEAEAPISRRGEERKIFTSSSVQRSKICMIAS
jgi:hypothetical protein